MYFNLLSGYVHQLDDTTYRSDDDMDLTKPFLLFQTKTSGHHSEPMVAMVCPEKGEPGAKLFHNKFLSSDGKWQTDTDYTVSYTHLTLPTNREV